MAFVFMLTLAFSTAAAESGEMSEAEVRQYALEYMQGSQPDREIALNRFETLYAISGEVSGYYATFISGSDPAGYILMSLRTNGSPVVELAFEGPGLIESSKNAEVFRTLLTDDNAPIIFESAGALFVPMQDGNYYSVYEHETVSKESVKTVAQLNRNARDIDWAIDWDAAKIDGSTVFKIQNFGSGTDYFLMSQFQNPNTNCAPTAGTNILWYWGVKRGCSSVMQRIGTSGTALSRAKIIFQYLQSGMGTTEQGTNEGNVMAGFKKFFSGANPVAGGTWNFVKLSNSAYLQEYKDALNNNCPVMLVTAQGNVAHAMFEFGYATSTDNTGYHFVMDGYNNYGRFVKYGYWSQEFGYKIWVK